MSREKCHNKPDECKYKQPFTDEHHKYWPRRDYERAGTIEARWRNLGINVVRICRCAHDEIHATQQPPEMPPRERMVNDLLGSHEHQTRAVRDALQSAIRAREARRGRA